MKVNLLSTIYEEKDESRSIECGDENLNMVNLLTSQNRTPSAGLTKIVIQNKFPLINECSSTHV